MEGNNIDDMFSQMLGELDDLTQQLNTVSVASKGTTGKSTTSDQQQEAFHDTSAVQQNNDFTDFDEEDVNLTAILNDLSQIQDNINKSNEDIYIEDDHNDIQVPDVDIPEPKVQEQEPPPQEKEFSQAHEFSNPVEVISVQQSQESFAHQEVSPQETELLSNRSSQEINEQEKVRIALEKLKEARILKLVVKVYNKDDSSKTLVIDERMSTRDVIQQLIEKNHFDFSLHWSLIEEMPSLHLERVFEEHEKPCELMKHWTRDSTNQLRFVERKDKYAMFKNPQHFLLSTSELQEQMQETQKQLLIEEFFSEKGPSSCTPEVDGFLHIKNGKSWSRKYCVLRSSGLYISKTGEPKKGKKLTDLTCLVMFEQNYLYVGRGWKKKFKAPFEYGFALKNPAIQVKSKHIRCLACEDFKSFLRWTVGIRLAKYGRQLLESYELTTQDMKSRSSVPVTAYQIDSKSVNQTNATTDPNLRSATLPRHVDVKNMFEGAWQRASQPEPYEKSAAVESMQCSTIPRVKSSFKSSQKKGSNWWDMRDSGQGSSQSNFDDSSLASGDDFQSNFTAEASVPSSDSDFDLPPPPEDFPPPPSMEDLRLAHGKPLPPPPAAKPKFKSSHDCLPASVGSKPTPPNKPAPLPKPSNLRSSDPDLRFKMPPPPVHPKRTGSNASLRSSGRSEPPPAPPLNLPPPPQNGGVAPLSNYYMSGDVKEGYSKDEFPPPPPFILDLKESFDAVTEPVGRDRKQSIDQAPKPGKLIAYIKSQTLSRLGNRTKAKKAPPAPPRNNQTRLSLKKR